MSISLPSNHSILSDIFGDSVFSRETAKDYLKSDIHQKLFAKCLNNSLSREEMQHIANALRLWAMGKGATHYTHWFQPLTGNTAMKHDAFFSRCGDGRYLEDFGVDALIQQESDASSLPNGGLRSTFEARGYTAWDPTSPPFILEHKTGKTLCIPSVFVTYKGASLDYKTPLLKSCEVLKIVALKVAQLIDSRVTEITPTLGWEQEYFLLDREIAMQRPDIIFTDRTLIGAPAPKGQQLNDHYYANIPIRVYNFMQDFENTAYRLGIPLKTRHNEVAPCQFECAPIFEEVNIAVDHNTLLMDIMRDIAKKHGLKVIFHEKPFRGINGSGKHCNWSLGSNIGNLLAPGRDPQSNLLFLSYFVSILYAVKNHAPLLGMSCASASNDLRLGASEAPPGIISVFIGSALTGLLEEIASIKSVVSVQKTKALSLFLQKSIPEIQAHNTDRNRTSPFAFTGDKFEFRAPGSASNCASAILVLNTIVADSLQNFYNKVESYLTQNILKEQAIMEVIKEYIIDSLDILFEGDNYSNEWLQESKKRGLTIALNTPQSLEFMHSEMAETLFTSWEIFSKTELEARYEIQLTNYIHKVEIELRSFKSLYYNYVLPASISYQNNLCKNIHFLQQMGIESNVAMSLNENIAQHLAILQQGIDKLDIELKKLSQYNNTKKAQYLAECLRPQTELLRKNIDAIEEIIPDQYWKLPKYAQLLYL